MATMQAHTGSEGLFMTQMHRVAEHELCRDEYELHQAVTAARFAHDPRNPWDRIGTQVMRGKHGAPRDMGKPIEIKPTLMQRLHSLLITIAGH